MRITKNTPFTISDVGTDNYDANILAEMWKGSFCFDVDLKQWLCYDAGRWLKDEKKTRVKKASYALTKHYNTLVSLNRIKYMDDAVKRVKVVNSTHGINQILEQVRWLLAIHSNELEQKP